MNKKVRYTFSSPVTVNEKPRVDLIEWSNDHFIVFLNSDFKGKERDN